MPLTPFHHFTARWFTETLGAPTRAQALGWAAIRDRRHTLIAAPTGSGKTLAAFLIALDDLVREGLETPLPDAVRVIYVSPLKALSADIHKNLAEPRRGIRRVAEEAGVDLPRITAAVRTGDTTQAERAAMLRTPPHVLVTTPESLYLLLTAERSRDMLRTARTVIVDEIHAVIGTRRGAHLALSLERLEALVDGPLQRIGLSATQKPIDDVARFLVGAGAVDADGSADCVVVDEGHRREMDLQIELPRSPLEAVMSHEIWAEHYDRLTDLISAHRTTLVFVNTRRLAERLTRQLSERLGEDAVTAHHGSLSKERRLDAETRLKAGTLKALVATASLELGIDIGAVDLVCQIGSPHRIATFLQRVGRSGHSISGTPKGRLFPISRDDLVECVALVRAVHQGELDRIVSQEQPLDVLAQQIVAEVSCAEYHEDALFALVTRAWPYRALPREEFDAVVRMTAEGFATRRGRRTGLVHRDEVHQRLRGRRGARLQAIASGGAIPEVADYRVVADPDDTFIGTLNEDFAIESSAGDVFQLGNAAWRVLQVGPGIVRVVDAHGAPPTLPFWLGEAPGRSDELSQAASALGAQIDTALADGRDAALGVLRGEAGIPEPALEQLVDYLADGRRALGVVPTQDTLVVERFFDEAGGMQLVIHAPFGSRINKAWGLALRKRFCRQFNFELQAAATENALLLSLGPQHSFPLADVFRYLHPATARDVLVQAFLDAPVFQTRWRWNATISLAVPRNRGGKKVPAPIQRMLADDLMAAVFPDAAACLENIPGDRQIPDHPLVQQTIRDCLQEAMDFDGLARILGRIQRGELTLVSRDTPEPSVFAHEILNARPYAFLDDAPLEERRAHAVYARRATDFASGDELGALDPDAIARVVDEERLDVRDANELHDALLTRGFLTDSESADVRSLLATLRQAGRATRLRTSRGIGLWTAAERLPEMQAVHPDASMEPRIAAPPRRAEKAWTRSDALVELVRGRVAVTGPTTSAALAASLDLGEAEIDDALVALEGEGLVLRGRFAPGSRGSSAAREWCDRRLLARIHRYTLNRLRAEIEPVSPADFMRFLLVWQHVDPAARLTGTEGLREVIARLDGYELPAQAWERFVLPARLDRYDPSMLDMLCLTGQVSWARLSPSPARTASAGSRPDAAAGAASTEDDAGAASPAALTGATAVALALRENLDAWRALAAGASAPVDPGGDAKVVLEWLRAHGASFLHEIAAGTGFDRDRVRQALAALVNAGLVASDGFAGLRSLVQSGQAARSRDGIDHAGRWWPHADAGEPSDEIVERKARALLARYGIVARRLLVREPGLPPWRQLVRVYRWLELRGEIRGGRFVTGMSGEQFALPEAVARVREIRREAPQGRLVVISAADPLNLVGILTAGHRVRAVAGNRIAYRDGVPVAVMEGEYLRPLTTIDPSDAGAIASALAGRRVPPVISGYIGRAV